MSVLYINEQEIGDLIKKKHFLSKDKFEIF